MYSDTKKIKYPHEDKGKDEIVLLHEFQDLVKDAREYFHDNNKRFHYFRNVFFNTSIEPKQEAAWIAQKKSILEFNIGESFISRLLGEWSKQEPSLIVRPKNDNPVGIKECEFVEDYLRYLLFDANKKFLEYDTYQETMSGGFSSALLFTDYEDGRSFNQVFKIEKSYDPTLTGFDPLAVLPDKSDANYAYEIFPKTDDELKCMGIDTEDLKFDQSSENVNFSWSFSQSGNNKKIGVVCHLYKKYHVEKKIYKLNTGFTMDEDELKVHMEMLDKLKIKFKPQILKERVSYTTEVYRYTIIENKILECKKVIFNNIPLVFFDGNSVYLRKDENAPLKQMTRPYLYQLLGTQRLKNLAGITLGNELERRMQAKWKMAIEGLPTQPEYREALLNDQIPALVMYKAFRDDLPTVPIPPPQEVMQPPAPPEIMQTFDLCDKTSQIVLGAVNGGMPNGNSNPFFAASGEAIQEATTNSNAAAMPYVDRYLQSLAHIGQMIVDAMPLVLKDPQKIPVKRRSGDKEYVNINQPGGMSINFPSGAIEVCVTAGVNFEIQKKQSLAQMAVTGQAFPVFADFMGKKGLSVIVDNIDCRGSDQLKLLVKEYEADMKKQTAAQAQSGQQQKPMLMKIQAQMQDNEQKNQLEQQKLSVNSQLEEKKLNIEHLEQVNNATKILLKAHEQENKNTVDLHKSQVEQTGQLVDLAINTAHKAKDQLGNQQDQQHRHAKERAEFAHKIIHSQSQSMNNNADNSSSDSAQPSADKEVTQ
jgi:hypothetical protein